MDKNYSAPNHNRFGSQTTAYSDSSNSSYPRESRLGSGGRRANNGFNTLGKNIIGNGVLSEPVTRGSDYTSTIKKPTEYRKAGDKYDNTMVYKVNSGITTSDSAHSALAKQEEHKKYVLDKWRNPAKQQVWENSSKYTANSNFRNDKMNDTFTSQKAKRNVSDYYNIKNRHVHSREKEDHKIDSSKSPDFATIGLENAGNT